MFLSHFEQPCPTGLHGFVQVPEGTILDHNRLSFLSMDYPFNAKHPVPPLSLTNTGTSRQRERPRTSSAGRPRALEFQPEERAMRRAASAITVTEDVVVIELALHQGAVIAEQAGLTGA